MKPSFNNQNSYQSNGGYRPNRPGNYEDDYSNNESDFNDYYQNVSFGDRGRVPQPGHSFFFFLRRNQIDQASKITNFTVDRHHRTIDRQMASILTILPTTVHRLTAITKKIDQIARTNLKSLLITVHRISQTSMNRRRTTITATIDHTRSRATNRIVRILS